MKPTIIYEEHDEQKIITGFGLLVIEPVETAKKVDGYIDDKSKKHPGLLEECEEFKILDKKKKEIGDKHKKAVASWNAANAAKKTRNKKGEDLHARDWRQTGQEVQDLMNELPDLNKKLTEKRKVLFADNAVYFEPRAGEIETTIETMADLKKKYTERTEGSLLTVEGEEVFDLRETQYFILASGSWEPRMITRLGEKIPTKGKLYHDLTPSEALKVDKVLISRLTPSEREQQYAKAMENALEQATKLKAELELKGNPDYLAESQKKYKEQIALIEELYSV